MNTYCAPGFVIYVSVCTYVYTRICAYYNICCKNGEKQLFQHRVLASYITIIYIIYKIIYII